MPPGRTYDLIIIGAGSAGCPAALEAARLGLAVLVLEACPSPGQGENKRAIGGVRATHPNPAKFALCRRSLEIFAAWEETSGADIHWRANGYSFPAWTEEVESSLQDLMKIQKAFGLNIDWLSPQEYRELNPGVNREGLRGSTYSPGDGSASPLLFIESCYFEAVKKGAEFRFHERVTGFEMAGGRIAQVVTDRGRYPAGRVLNAAGAGAQAVARLAGLDAPVAVEGHDALITEPVKRLMGPMIVDLRRSPGIAACYFHQIAEGQVVACVSPDPPQPGGDVRSGSAFLTLAGRRMIEVLPALARLKVRRTWRGLFPSAPDGLPLVGRAAGVENFYQAVGLGGSGFMLGPGLGELLGRLLTDRLVDADRPILSRLDPNRDFPPGPGGPGQD